MKNTFELRERLIFSIDNKNIDIDSWKKELVKARSLESWDIVVVNNQVIIKLLVSADTIAECIKAMTAVRNDLHHYYSSIIDGQQIIKQVRAMFSSKNAVNVGISDNTIEIFWDCELYKLTKEEVYRCSKGATKRPQEYVWSMSCRFRVYDFHTRYNEVVDLIDKYKARVNNLKLKAYERYLADNS